MTTPIKWGTEFLVNTRTQGSQFEPTITALSDGRFVVAWTENDGDQRIWAQIFGADGAAQGGQFEVQTIDFSNQFQPSITALSDGRFVVGWTDSSNLEGDTEVLAVRAQVFGADGTKEGPDLLVNTTTAAGQSQPTITGLADGRFVVAWVDGSETGGDTSSTAIRAQIFDADGARQGAELLVNMSALGQQFAPTIAALADGRFVVAWADESRTGGDTSGFAIRAQVFGADGTKLGAELLVNGNSVNDQFQPIIIALADGRFVVAWSDFSQTGDDTSSGAIRAQVFGADATKQGAELLVNTTTADNQFAPSITALADGRFVVVWTDFSQTGGDTSDLAVRAQVFGADGAKQGAEFVVNTITAGPQFQPTITALADGRIAVAWTDGSMTGGDTSVAAIRGQILDPREAAVSLGGTLGADDWVGTVYADRMEGSFGADRLRGGAGDDQLWGEEDADRLSGDAGNDRLWGGDGNDQLWGGAGSDRLWGGAGDDRLDGGGGGTGDVMEGGAGNDTYVFRTLNDRVGERAGEGSDTVQVAFSVALSVESHIENAVLTGTAAASLTGSTVANRLTGNAGSNVLLGSAGNDTLDGGGGTGDRLDGGVGNDLFLLRSSLDTVVERAGEGSDTVSAAFALNLAFYANVENATMTGSAGGTLAGTAGANRLTGSAGNNSLLGGAGNDTLRGGLGNDTLTGGGGADVFAFDRNGGLDRITDWQDGLDRLDLSAWDLASTAAALAKATQVGTSLVFTLATGHTLTLLDTAKAEIGTSDLIL